MTRMIWLLAALLLVAPAQAHGPTRQKVSESVDIDASPDQVWAVVSDFGGLAAWDAEVASSPADQGNAIGSKRTVTLRREGTAPFVEELAKYSDADRSYMYRIGEVDVKTLPVNNFTGWLDVAAGETGGTRVTWRAAFYRGYPLNDPPPELNDEASAAAVRAYVRAGLEGLRAKLGRAG